MPEDRVEIAGRLKDVVTREGLWEAIYGGQVFGPTTLAASKRIAW